MMDPSRNENALTDAELPVADDAASAPAWQEIEQGRYMPRRVRGSYRGRVLG